MINLETECPLRLNQIPACFRKLGLKAPNLSTIYRWASRGSRGRKLELLKAGGTFYTTREAIKRFLQPDEPAAPLVPSVKARRLAHQRRVEAAIAECERLGA